MAKKRKVNPWRKPATQADVSKAKREAMDQAVQFAWAIMFSVLYDKYGWRKVRLRKLWDHVNNLSDSIAQGYVDIDDLMQTLDEEADIVLR